MHKATSSLNHFTGDDSHKDLPDLRIGKDPQVPMGEELTLHCDENEKCNGCQNWII